jgi:hypothetical protein
VLAHYPLLLGAPAAVGVVVVLAAVAALGLVLVAVLAGPAPPPPGPVVRPGAPEPPARQCDPSAAGRPHPRAPWRRATARAD